MLLHSFFRWIISCLWVTVQVAMDSKLKYCDFICYKFHSVQRPLQYKKNTYLTKLTKWLVWMLWNLCHLYTSRMFCQKQIEPIIITDAVYIWYNTDAHSTSDILHMLESANNRTIGRGKNVCFDASGLNMFEQSLKGPQLHEQVDGLSTWWFIHLFLIASWITHLIAVHL